MTKKSIILIIAVVMCLFVVQGVVAADTEEFKTLDYTREDFSLEEAFWFNPTVYCVDVVQFLQAYLNPENPVDFFVKAADYSDEEIEGYFTIYQSFMEPEYAGLVSFANSCDVEAYAASIGYVFNPDTTYSFSYYFNDLQDVASIFPRGIGRTNAYDTFRRTAAHLAWFASVNGTTPGFEGSYAYIEAVLAYYEQQFEAAMEAEANSAGSQTTEVELVYEQPSEQSSESAN